MQFQIACKHCHRPFVIESEGGNTLKCNCPYCGESMIVATPQEDVTRGSSAETTATVNHTANCSNEVWKVLEEWIRKEDYNHLYLYIVVRDTAIIPLIYDFLSNVELNNNTLNL